MLDALKNAFRIKDLREKILFTIAMLVLYRIGSYHYNWHADFELLVVLKGSVEMWLGLLKSRNSSR